MRKLLLTSFAAAFMLQARAQSFSHAPVPVTGFTADVIANGAGPSVNSTTADVDGQNYNFVAQNFVNPTNQSPTTYLPGSGLVNSLVTPGLTFQLASYTGNNSLRLTTTTSSGTLTFVTPRVADKVNVLVTTAYPSSFTATVTFTDATSQAFTGNSVPNWFDGASPAVQGIGRVLRTTDAIENSTTNPRMYQYSFVLSPANATKTIESITFTKTSTATNEVLHIFAVSASMTNANDAGISAITAPSGTVAPGSQPVTVTVKNYGASPLTAATLGFSVNGTTVVNNYAFTDATGIVTNGISTPVTIGNFNFPVGVNTIKAWSNLPNGVTDPSRINDTVQVSVVACNTLSGNYTINKNAAQSATNFPSFAAALQVLTSCGVNGPVTFSVAPNSGPYNEQITLPVINGTSATNTVTFEGNGNTFTAATTAAKPGVITFNGADYVKINNFKINLDLANPAAWGVQLINASDNDVISNCTINVPYNTSSTVYQGIQVGTNASTLGNYANNLLIQNNIINGGYYGIVITGTTTGTPTSGNRIIGNQIRDAYGYGIYLTTAGTGTIVEGNDISRPTRTNSTGTFYGIYLGGTTTNTLVNKNRIHNTHDMNIATVNTVYGIYTLASATVGNENIIKNNLIYNINNPGGSIYAFYNSGGNGTYYYHNTVSIDDLNMAYATLRGMHFQSASTNVKFINNIVSLTSPGTSKHGIYLASTSGLALTSNNNDLYIGSTGNTGYYAADKATLADWKGVNTNAYDQNSIAADPVFVNPTKNFRPLVPAPNDLGQPVAAVTDDINGATRSTTTPDMGAYEFTPAANDAGVTAINAPVSPVVPGSQPVTVTLKNFGTANLTAATIGWSVNNVTQAPYTWSGNLATLTAITAPQQIGTYNFTAGAYTVKVWSQNPNGSPDGVTANDTTTIRINSCTPLAGNYTVNKNNAASATNFQSLSAIATKLAECGVSGPVTVTVTSGTGPYNEQVEIQNIPNTSATNTVTFEGSGNTVSVAPTGRPGIFVLNGADYVKLNNFVITLPTTATSGWGVQLINAADNNTISNNTINLPLTTTASDINGIISGVAVNIAGNNASNTKILNNSINGGSMSIQLNGNTGGLNASNNQIVGNQLKEMYSYCVYINGGNGTLIEANDMSRPLRTNGSTFYGVYLTGTTLNTIVNKNRIHNTSDAQPTGSITVYGVYTTAPATVGNENIIKNNLIYNIKNATGSFYALYNSGGNGTYYYHNTVVSDAATTYNFIRGMYFVSASTNVKFINNILWLPGTTSGKYGIYCSSTGISLVSNNNLLNVGSNTNSYVGYYNGNQATLANWKAANSSAFDQNSIETDPVFANLATGDLKPTALTVDNLGQPVAAVTDDITGAVRNATTPDMGAYEFGTVTLSDDAGVTAFINPVNGCNLTNQELVTITIKNFGTTTLNNIPVSYKVNAGTPVNETFTGSLAPGASTNYTFGAKLNMSAPGIYTIIGSANLAQDATPANNSLTVTVTASAPAAVPTITAGGSTTLCTGGSVTLTAVSATTGATYTWFNNGTAISGATSATYTANAAGSYTAVATANGCPSAASAATAVTVGTAAAVPTITASGPLAICSGGSVTLTAASTTTGATFTWFNNGTAIAGATSATYTANAAGSYTAVATANGCPSAASAATVVTLNAAPAVPTFTATTGTTTFCTGGSVTFTATSTTTGVTYQWFNNGTAIPAATAATYTATAAGSYTVNATANGCSATSAATAVTVNAKPAAATITLNGFVLTSSAATGNQWYLNGTIIPGATSVTYTTTANGNYTVIVTANGCSSAASNAISITNTGIKENENLQVAVYPNPSEGLVKVTLPNGHAYELEVTDLTGKVILTEKVTASKTQLNLSKTAKGIYLLKVSGENGTAIRKLVIE